MGLLSGKKLLLLGFIVVLLVIIPLTVYLVGQQQKTRIGAAPATSITFVPPSRSVTVGQPVNFEIWVDPGSNQISFVKLVIDYDQAKLQAGASALTPNASAFEPALQDPTYTPGNISVTLSVGANPNRIIQTRTRVASLVLQALSETAGTPTRIAFDTGANQTQVLSIASADQFNENVLLLSSLIPAEVTIAQAAGTPSPSPSASPASGGTSPANKLPVCTGFSLDRASSGKAPYSIAFTATGNDTDGTISKVTFDFGDSPVVDETQGGGIGTNQASVQKSHTYNNPSTYTATAVFTDNDGALSSISAKCTETIKITSSTGVDGGVSTIATVASPTSTPAATVSETPIPAISTTTKGGLPPVGPEDKIISLGAIGAILSVLGVLLLLAL